MSVRSVVFLTYHFPPEVGGIQTRISRYVSNLAGRGVRVRVLACGRNPALRTIEGVDIEMCPPGMGGLPRSLLLVVRSVVSSRAQVVHVFTGCSTLLGALTVVCARSYGARPVVSFFGREDFAFSGLVSRMLFAVSTNLSRSIDVNSEATGALLPPRARKKSVAASHRSGYSKPCLFQK